MQYCVYYNNKTDAIIDIIPESIDPGFRAAIERAWNQEITRKMLIELSRLEETTAARLKDAIGHSSSTLHENIRRLEELGLIESEMVYKGNKQKMLKARIITVSKNPEHKRRFKKYFQGIWIESDKSKEVIGFLKKNKGTFFTAEEISAQTGIPVDDVELQLSNWDSFTSRALSEFLKERPFEKKTLYRSR